MKNDAAGGSGRLNQWALDRSPCSPCSPLVAPDKEGDEEAGNATPAGYVCWRLTTTKHEPGHMSRIAKACVQIVAD